MDGRDHYFGGKDRQIKTFFSALLFRRWFILIIMAFFFFLKLFSEIICLAVYKENQKNISLPHYIGSVLSFANVHSVFLETAVFAGQTCWCAEVGRSCSMLFLL